MTVCNLFKELTKDTGNFLMFEQYAEDLTRYLAQHNVAQVQPSRFLALDIDYSAIDKHNISEIDPNRIIPNVIQNYYENACAYFKYSMGEEEYTPLISRNAFWNALNDAGLLHFDEFTTDATTIFNENDEPVVSPPTGLKWLRELKYRGDINLHSYTEEDCIGYNEVYCYIPGDAPDRRYGVKLNNDVLSLPYDRDLIMGFKEEDRDFEGILDLFVGDGYEYPYSEVISFFDENESDLESYKTEAKKFTFNTLVVLYDIVTESGVLFKDIPLGMYLTGRADGEGNISVITKYVSNSDIYGAGTSYGLRISTKFNVTPNATYIKEVLVNDEDYTSEFIRTLSSFSESQKKMNDILSSVEANNLSIKNHLSSFKNYRTNIPYPVRIGDKMYWFVNGKNTNATLQGTEGPQGVTGERGPAGNQGPRGIRGVTGLRGIQGATGPAGPTGPAGATGPAGGGSDPIITRDIIADVTIGGINAGDLIETGLTFTDFVERLFTVVSWGSVGDITRTGSVSIAAPVLVVEKQENGSWVEITSGTEVQENSHIRVTVANVPESAITGESAYMQKTGNVLAYGWLKTKNDEEEISGTGNCSIDVKHSTTNKDRLNILSKSGCFADLQVDSATGKISSEFVISASANPCGSFSLQSASKVYQIQSDGKFVIFAKSNKGTTSDDVKKVVANNENLGNPLSESSTSQEFVLNVEQWGYIPNASLSGEVNINAPTIVAQKSSDGTNWETISSGTELYPDEYLKLSVPTISGSYISKAFDIKFPSDTFTYGWKKTKSGETGITGTGDCHIGTSYTTTDSDELTASGSGFFANVSVVNNSITINPTQVGNQGGTLTVTSNSKKYQRISDAAYTIEALSSLGSVKNTNTTRKQITNAENFGSVLSKSRSNSFTFSIKAYTYSQFYAWGVQGTIESGGNTSVEQMINSIIGHNDISDAELTALGMTKYTGPVYNGTLSSLNGGFLVVLSKELPATLLDELGLNMCSNPRNWWDYGTITRNETVYHVYLFPNDYEGIDSRYGTLTLNS